MIGMLIFLLLPSELLVIAPGVDHAVFINEIESNDTATDIDWIEIINTGNSKIDISGWFVSDDKGLEHVENNKEWRILEGTVLAAGEILVVKHDVVLANLSLGKNDIVSLYCARIHFISYWHSNKPNDEKKSGKINELKKHL